VNQESEKIYDPKTQSSLKNALASVQLTIFLMSLTALTVLIGAWCPQESASGKEKVIEQFGADTAKLLTQFGITDIYHSPFFLSLIAMLTVNMIACSFLRVFPRIKLLQKPLPFLSGKDIGKLPVNTSVALKGNDQSALTALAVRLSARGFKVATSGDKLLAEYGRFGRLAATVTHIGLLTLLVGVTITSWTGFSGFQPVLLNSHLDFSQSEHSKLWVGKLPTWTVRVDATHREDYPTGEPKQWFSKLTVLDTQGKEIKTQEISVNNPLSYDGVDIYQSSWGLDHIFLNFNGKEKRLDLQPMGKLYAAFLPLDQNSVMIFSVRADGIIKVFAKRPDWEAPRQLGEITKDKPAKLGPVTISLMRVMPVTGLQYKCDPGLPITYVAFAFIIVGVLMAAIPHRHVWVSLETGSKKEGATGNENKTDDMAPSKILYFGGRSVKAKVGFERLIKTLESQMASEFGIPKVEISEAQPTEKLNAGHTNESSAQKKKEHVLAGSSADSNAKDAQGDS